MEQEEIITDEVIEEGVEWTQEDQEQEWEEEGQEAWEEITLEQALKWKEDLKKASKKIADLKKEIKTAPKSSDDVRAILAEERFYEKNPEAEPYRKQLESYVKKWLTRDEALILVSRQDKEIEKTKEVYWKPLVWWGATQDISAVSVDVFDKMTSKQQEEYTNKMTSKYGKVKFK